MKYINGEFVPDNKQEAANLPTAVPNTNAEPIPDDEPNKPSYSQQKQIENASLIKDYSKSSDERTEDEIKKIADGDPKIEQYLRDNKGILGGLKVAGESAGNELAFGVPDVAYQHLGDPEQVKEYNALNQLHRGYQVAGGVAGAAGSLLYGGELFKGAEGLGQVAQAALAGGEDAGIARKILAGAAKYGTEGAAISAPKALTQLAFGDTDKAGETLAYGFGGGAALGGFASGVGPLAEKFSGQLGKSLKTLSDKTTLANDDLIGLLGNDAIKANNDVIQGAKDSLTSAVSNTAGTVGAFSSHGLLGGVIKSGTKKVVSGALDMIPDEVYSKALNVISKSAEAASNKLNEIPDVLSSLNDKGFTGGTLGGTSFSRFSSDHDNDKNEQESFKKLSDKLVDFQTNPETATKNISDTAAIIAKATGSQKLADAYTEKQTIALNYLASKVPKDPSPPQPFTKNNWQASDMQIQEFKSVLDMITHPYNAVDKLKKGTLSTTDVQTLKDVWPQTYNDIANKVLDSSFDKKFQDMPYAAKTQLSLLTGKPMDPSFNPESIAALQANFIQSNGGNAGTSGIQNSGKGSKKALSNNPSVQTEVQNISAGQPGENS